MTSGSRCHWRWLLLEADSGNPIMDHKVRLDPTSEQVKALLDPYRMLRRHRMPEVTDGAVDMETLAKDLGLFIGTDVLGEPIGREIVARAPVTVRVELPLEAAWMAALPLELVHLDGCPLAAREDVALIYEPLGASQYPKEPVGEVVRVLGVFSRSAATYCASVRRERINLQRLVGVLARSRRRMEFVVAQYGMTRDRLSELIGDGIGWDILHLSVDAVSGQLQLENADGTPNVLSQESLLQVLAPLKPRIKLAVLTAHESFAAATAAALFEVGDTTSAQKFDNQAWEELSGYLKQRESLPLPLARTLACAVVAMRYPVPGTVAVSFSDRLYRQILDAPKTVGQAVATAWASTSGDPNASACTPAIYGASALDLTIRPQRSNPHIDINGSPVAYVPPEPDLFVGQSAVMAAASQALAPGSGRSGVALYGGTGKSWCARELAHGHQLTFGALLYWTLPADTKFTDGLASLAQASEAQLGRYGFTMVDDVSTMKGLVGYLPRLRELLRMQGLLIVLDGLDELLTSEGAWRDPRWHELTEVLIGHDGESRVVFTSRVKPVKLEPPLIEVQHLGMLSRFESLHLLRQLPVLGGWLSDHTSVQSTSLGSSRREVALAVLDVWEGHPQLLTFADLAVDGTKSLPTSTALNTAAEAARAAAPPETPVPDATQIQAMLEVLSALRT